MEAAPSPEPRRYVWPWALLVMLVLGILLAILWVSAEVRRTKERREYRMPDSRTNVPGGG